MKRPKLYYVHAKLKNTEKHKEIYTERSERNTDMRNECQVQDIVRLGRQRRKECDAHVSRMEPLLLAKVARDEIRETLPR